MKTLILIFTMLSFVMAINPPNKGRFPAKLAQILKDNPDFLKYGDPGMIKKIAENIARKDQSNFGKTAAINFRLPVILGAFSDVTGTISSSTFQDSLFDSNSGGTLTDYYNEISYSNFNLTGDVYGWFTADGAQADYEGDGNGFGGAFDDNVKGYIRNIVSIADASVDFSQYDSDGDGYVDAVCVVYPQAGPDWSPTNDSFWPHMSSIAENEYITNDGVKISSYLVCPEQAGSGTGNGAIRPIGVFAHEFGHVLGLPDLYDRTDNTEGPDSLDSEGIGEWCLMASGSWGGDGAHTETPAHMSAWCKIQMGWITPTEITAAVNGLSISQLETNAEAYIVWEDPYEWSRYFLLENRQKVGFDQYLNGDGLLIYHIDENRRWGVAAWSSGYVNDNETHKMVDIEEADGQANLDANENRGDAGDPFPGTTTNTSFTNSSSPSSKDYNNQSTGVSITNINSSSSSMTVDIIPRQTLGYALAYDEMGLTGSVVGLPDPQNSWGGVLFTASDAGILKAVDIGFVWDNQDFEILVYSSFNTTNNRPGTLIGSKSGHIDDVGWYTFSFDNDIDVSAGQSFFIAVKIQNQKLAISIDPFGPVDSRSYFSGDGVNYQTISQYGDMNLRARIQTDSAIPLALDGTEEIVNKYALKQNFPNPFNPKTLINYQLAEHGKVNLSVYDINGRLVKTLVDQQQSAGSYTVEFNADKLASGLYIYKIVAKNFSETRKMLLVK